MDTKVQKKVFYTKFSPSSVSYSAYLAMFSFVNRNQPHLKLS
jgi:hypothetical protein